MHIYLPQVAEVPAAETVELQEDDLPDTAPSEERAEPGPEPNIFLEELERRRAEPVPEPAALFVDRWEKAGLE